MNRIKKAIQCWKEYDSIKIAVILSFLVLILFDAILKSCFSYYALLSSPIEINCTFSDYLSVTESMKKTDVILGYSKMIEKQLSVDENTIHIDCVNANYIYQCYNLKAMNSNTIWLNQKGYELLFAKEQASQIMKKAYLGEDYRQFIFKQLNLLPNDKPYAIMILGEAELKESNRMKICMKTINPSQQSKTLDVLHLQSENNESILKLQYSQTELIYTLKYRLLVICISLIGILSNLKIYHFQKS